MLNTPLSPIKNVHSAVQHSDAFLTSIAKLLDASIIVVMLMVPSLLRADAWSLRYTVALLVAIMTFHVIAELMTLYRPWRGESVTRQFFRLLRVWIGTMFVLLFVAYLFKATAGFSRLAVTTWFIMTPVLMSGWRTLARMILARWLERDAMRRSAVVWGSGKIADQLATTIESSIGPGLRLIEHIVPENDGQLAEVGHDEATDDSIEIPPSQAALLEQRARRGDFSILYIVLGTVTKTAAIDVVERLADTTVSVYLVPDFLETYLFNGQWSSLGDIPLVSLFDTPFWGAHGWLKKVQDLMLSTVILALAAIPMALVALAVKLTSQGPILFRQRRYGIDGKEITVIKFRTMTVSEDGANVIQARKNDPRLTSIGGFLRKHSLDELPQFINVLRGDMSIVGPRPHAVAHNEVYRRKVKGYMLRHKVKPGITGWAQINGWRGETDNLHKMEKRLEYDLWYIRNWSFWLDIKIILITLLRGFASPNAY